MMYDTDHMTAGGWVFASFMMLLLIAVVVILVVWLARTTSQGGAVDRAAGGHGNSARDLLDRRLASGEIDEDEYRRLRDAMSDAPAPPRPVASG